MFGEPGMVERDSEVAQIEALIGAAVSGRGALAVIEGPAGIGKTALISAARESAAAAGLRVLSARGGELESEFGFGVARQLLEPVVRAAPARARLDDGAAGFAARLLVPGEPASASPGLTDASFTALHSLYWLVADLASEGPLLLAIDDLHWADAASLRWLVYLAPRLEELPLLLLVGARSAELSSEPALLEALARATRMRPALLSEPAVAQLLASSLGSDVDAEFAAACHAATGGNPFLLGELVGELRVERVQPNAANASHVAAIGPSGVSRAVLARLGRLSPEAVATAQSVSVLGEDADPATVAALAGISEEAARDAADALVIAGILLNRHPLGFVHPIVRTAIYADTPPSRRADAHARAAQLLAGAGAEPQRVAAHLLQCDTRGDMFTVERLAAAAELAMARGAPETAVTYLRRALAEPPSGAARGEVLAALGRAEACGAHADAESAIAHLSAALESITDAAAHAHAARVLGQVLLIADRGEDASRVLAAAVDAVPDDEPSLLAQLTADLLVVGMANAETRRIGARHLARLSPELQAQDSNAGRLTRGIAAGAALFAGASASAVTALARSALADGRLLADETADSLALYIPCLSLLWADDTEGAGRVFSDAIDEAHSRGSLRGFAMAAGLRAGVELRCGELADAETDARAVLQVTRETGLHLGTPVAGAVLIEVLIARGELGEAEALAELAAARPTSSLWAAWLADVTAQLRLEQRRFAGAVELSRRCGAGLSPWKLERWVPVPWRSTLGLGLARLAGPATDGDDPRHAPGRLDEARSLIVAELEDARRFGAPRLVGIALLALAAVSGGEAPETAREALEEAVAVLASSPARLEHARALVALGSFQRRTGEPTRARVALREGLALARRCGATPLARRAHEELEASGARVRKIVHGGVEALTPSERRVAEMAASGMTNRAIAQALFLTSRTVETHLAHAYQKLDIRGRGELGASLAGSS